MDERVDRRNFIGSLGVAATVAATAYVAAPRAAGAVAKPKGKIPATPFKVGHMTFQSGPGAALGAPALKGHTLCRRRNQRRGRISWRAQDRDDRGG